MLFLKLYRKDYRFTFMETRETISLEGQPFPAPLPSLVLELIPFFSHHDCRFENLGRTLLLNQPYNPERYAFVSSVLQKRGFDLKIEHSVWTVYEESDYRQADLLTVSEPEIWIDDLDWRISCPLCNRQKIKMDLTSLVPSVDSSRPLLCVNGQFVIVSQFMKGCISSGLSGAEFYPFDRESKYWVLGSSEDLGDLIILEQDAIGLSKRCIRCHGPCYDIFYGPYRYLRSNWHGADICIGEFWDGLRISQKAYKLFSSVEPKVKKSGIVVLV